MAKGKKKRPDVFASWMAQKIREWAKANLITESQANEILNFESKNW